MPVHLSILDSKMRTIAATWPPLPRAVAVASVHIGIFVAVCSISYIGLPTGSWLAAGLLAALAFASPLSGLLFILVAVAFQYLFRFDPSAFYQIAGVLGAAYIVRSLPITFREAQRLSPLWIVLVGFMGIVLLHLSADIGFDKNLQAVGFCFLAATIFLHTRSIAGTPDAMAVIATVCLSGLLASALSFIYLYFRYPTSSCRTCRCMICGTAIFACPVHRTIRMVLPASDRQDLFHSYCWCYSVLDRSLYGSRFSRPARSFSRQRPLNRLHCPYL